MEINTEYIPKREPLPVPKRVKHPSMAYWRNQDTSNWATGGAKPKGQIVLKVEYEGAIFEANVLKGSCYSLCALRSRVKTHFDVAKFRLELANEDGQMEAVTNQVEFEKAVKMGEKTGTVNFQVVIKVGNVEEPAHTPNRVSHSAIASTQLIREVVQGKKPSGQILLNVEYNGQVMEIAVLRSTSYTLCALRSRIKTKFGLSYVSLKHEEKDNTLVAVDTQAAFEKAVSKGEDNSSVNFKIVDKVEKKQEQVTPQRVEHPTMVSWNKAGNIYSALQGKKQSGQVLLKAMHEGRLMEMSVIADTTYTLRALKSRIRTKFNLTEFNLEYLDEENDVISLDTQVEFEKALKMGEKTGSVTFQVIDKMEDQDKMKPSWASRSLLRQTAQGKRPAGQIQMNFEFKVKALEMSVMKNTTYTLQALKSKIKTRLGFSNFVLKYFNGDESVSVDNQDDFEEALKVGEKQGNVNFVISAELPDCPEEFFEADQGQQ